MKAIIVFALVIGAGLFQQPAYAQAQQANGSDACIFDQIIDLRVGLPSTAARFFGEVSVTQIVFLGERAGTPEHVKLATCILAEKTGSRPPVLALEHVPASAQNVLDSWRLDRSTDPSDFATTVEWDALGRGDFAPYAPLIEGAIAARAHVIATDTPLPGRDGPSFEALIEVAPAYGLQTDEIVEAMIPDVIARQCELIDEDAARRLALAHMERDRIMAGRLIAGRGRGPSSLFLAARSHVRMDRSVPYLIARTDRPPSMLTVAAFTEDEWAALLEEGSARDQGLNMAFDVVVIAGQSDQTEEERCADLRAVLGG
ncbi:MAG: ChaN family lipoprotein [Pseudomonadota bacterium]